MRLQQFGCVFSRSINTQIASYHDRPIDFMGLFHIYGTSGLSCARQSEQTAAPLSTTRTEKLWCTGTVPARGENPTGQNTAFPLREQQPLLIVLPHRVQLLCVTTQLQTQIPSWLLAHFPQCLNLVISLLASQERTDQLVKDVDFQTSKMLLGLKKY